MTHRVLLSALLMLASASCATPAFHEREARLEPIQLASCRVPKSTDSVFCGKYVVFEDRAAGAGRRITLSIVVLPATGPKPAADPVFVLVGGPGLGAATLVTGDSDWFTGRSRSERDIVFVDQRGTGRSGRLQCSFGHGSALQNSFGELFPVDRVRACREMAAQHADVRFYTTPIAMDDLDDIRAALGYRKINLYGSSYGALAALQYLRQHPQRVRSMALAGVATPAAKQPLNFARAAHDALVTLLDDCAADAACRGAFPDLRAEFDAVLTAFDNGPVTFEMLHPISKVTEPVSMSRGVFVERLRLMLYDRDTASRVPLVIHRAAQGDWVPFATASRGGVASGVSTMYLTVTCSESVSVITEDDIVRESRNTFVGEYRTRTHVRACQEWPRAHVPPSYYEPVSSDAPVLMLSGELDAATPAHLGAEAARSLPNSRQVLIRNAAHGDSDDCVQNIVAEFLSRGSARDLDVACVEARRRPPFITEMARPS